MKSKPNTLFLYIPRGVWGRGWCACVCVCVCVCMGQVGIEVVQGLGVSVGVAGRVPAVRLFLYQNGLQTI